MRIDRTVRRLGPLLRPRRRHPARRSRRCPDGRPGRRLVAFLAAHPRRRRPSGSSCARHGSRRSVACSWRRPRARWSVACWPPGSRVSPVTFLRSGRPRGLVPGPVRRNPEDAEVELTLDCGDVTVTTRAGTGWSVEGEDRPRRPGDPRRREPAHRALGQWRPQPARLHRSSRDVADRPADGRARWASTLRSTRDRPPSTQAART